MWIPLNYKYLVSKNIEFRAILTKRMVEYPHIKVISRGEASGLNYISNSNAVERWVAELESTSISYIGSRHGIPIAPFCAFTQVSEYGVAHLEYLIEHIDFEKNINWFSNAIAIIFSTLFNDYPNIFYVSLPLITKEQSFGAFRIKKIGLNFYAVRRTCK